MPFISDIFKYLHGIMQKASKKKEGMMPARELVMLSTLSPFIASDAEADTIIRTLLPLLGRWKVKAAEKVAAAAAAGDTKSKAAAAVEKEASPTGLEESLETCLLRILHNAFVLSKKPRNYVVPILKLFGASSTTSGGGGGGGGSNSASHQNRKSRTLLTQILSDIASIDDQLRPLHDLAVETNAWNPKVLDEPDYGRRLSAFGEFTGNLSCALRQADKADEDENADENAESKDAEDSKSQTRLLEFKLLLMLYNSVHFLRLADDIALRSTSLNCIKEIILFLGLPANALLFKRIVNGHLMLEIRRSLADPKERTRHEFIGLLGQVVRSCGKVEESAANAAESSSKSASNAAAESSSKSFVVELSKLVDDHDVELDFFENLIHIQTHRRPRALTRLAKMLESKELGFEAVQTLIMPILTAILNEDSYLKHQNILVDECAKALVAVCKFSPWSVYYTTLMTFLKRLVIPGPKGRIALKVVVPLLECFHFDLSLAVNVGKGKGRRKGKEEKSEKNKEEQTNEMISADQNPDIEVETAMETTEGTTLTTTIKANSALQPDWARSNHPLPAEEATLIYQTIAKSIVPQLNKQLVQKKKGEEAHKLSKGDVYDENEALRVPLAMAMVKLLAKLPHGMLASHVSNVITKVIQFLKSFDKEVRQSARETLKNILVTLGPKYFLYIVRELKETLVRGFAKHVLNYSVHRLLKTLVGTKSMRKMLDSGDLDVCVPVLSEIYMDELFGQIGEEKEVEAITNKVHEAKGTCKSFESYLILAKNISASMLTTFLSPLKNKLNSSQSKEVIDKISTCLRFVSNSVCSLIVGRVGSDALLVYC